MNIVERAVAASDVLSPLTVANPGEPTACLVEGLEGIARYAGEVVNETAQFARARARGQFGAPTRSGSASGDGSVLSVVQLTEALVAAV
ncbi:hypothetical protein [Kutzneria buriramensis]|uniref:Uncharacterized protein n=1 Tax=Kutzneria buriramensis TaxID=1045776 RepID=A0A3E0GTF3_9PSEU|nr:hypothetical protein [Kutzneria buriramensis]REH27004.1 hypothetical protein BCF44_13159 [Kutzneria buriramensis]